MRQRSRVRTLFWLYIPLTAHFSRYSPLLFSFPYNYLRCLTHVSIDVYAFFAKRSIFAFNQSGHALLNILAPTTFSSNFLLCVGISGLKICIFAASLQDILT